MPIAGRERYEDARHISARARARSARSRCWRWPRCRGNAPAQTTEKAAPAGPPTIEVVKVVEQPLNVTLSLPGELTPYQTVALYSRVDRAS